MLVSTSRMVRTGVALSRRELDRMKMRTWRDVVLHANSSHASANHNGASEVSRLETLLPRMVFGSVPSFSNFANVSRICFTSSTIPAASKSAARK